jgi:hypothetical protein
MQQIVEAGKRGEAGKRPEKERPEKGVRLGFRGFRSRLGRRGARSASFGFVHGLPPGALPRMGAL